MKISNYPSGMGIFKKFLQAFFQYHKVLYCLDINNGLQACFTFSRSSIKSRNLLKHWRVGAILECVNEHQRYAFGHFKNFPLPARHCCGSRRVSISRYRTNITVNCRHSLRRIAQFLRLEEDQGRIDCSLRFQKGMKHVYCVYRSKQFSLMWQLRNIYKENLCLPVLGADCVCLCGC